MVVIRGVEVATAPVSRVSPGNPVVNMAAIPPIVKALHRHRTVMLHQVAANGM
jgi:hypothetical protein